jgi:uncharacterized protein
MSRATFALNRLSTTLTGNGYPNKSFASAGNLTAYVLDSSAAVKLYLAEPGTLWLKTIAEAVPANDFLIVRTTVVEVAAALFRRVRGQLLPRLAAEQALLRFRDHLTRVFQVVELTPSLMDAAVSIAEVRALRGYDCVQLGAAIAVQRIRRATNLDEPVLVTADRELIAAARAEGMRVEDPNAHLI